jgi:hypothetical protein
MTFDMPKTGTWEQRGGWVVRRLMSDCGLTIEQAAGIVGNIGFESGKFQSLHEIGQPEGSGGYGWAQWTASRRVSFLDWCKAHNLDWRSDEANYGYLLAELNTTQAKSLAQVKKTSTVEAAVFTFGYWFERPRGTTKTYLPGNAERLKYAQRALAGATAPPVVPTVPNDVVTPWDRLKAIQVILGVKPDGDFGENSWAAMNAVLEAANQPGIE